MSIDFKNFERLLELEHQCFASRLVKLNDISVNKAMLWKTILDNFTKDLRTNLSSYNFEIDCSIGQGNWTYIPWIRIADKVLSSDNKNGVFIGYQFGWEDNQAFLSILQGVEGKKSENELIEIKKNVQENVSEGSFVKMPIKTFIPPLPKNCSPSKRTRAKNYATGMIFHKQYTISALPDSEQLNADLQELIAIYANVKDLLLNSGEEK